MSESKPNPGSDEAIKLGCTCPVLDNGRGITQGWYGAFWVSGDCPLHHVPSPAEEPTP